MTRDLRWMLAGGMIVMLGIAMPLVWNRFDLPRYHVSLRRVHGTPLTRLEPEPIEEPAS